ncbi:MAG: hypothetical protein R6V52_02205 [Bacteroidales bacterium]
MGSYTEIDLHPGRTYHVYNRGNNSQQVFFRERDFFLFQELMQIFILPIADLYAYCLLRNHFHFVLKVKENRVYKYNIKNAPKEKIEKWACIERPEDYKSRGLKIPNPSRHLSHMFNSYAKCLNKKYVRHGSIFEKPFRRREIHGKNDLKNVIVYVNNNAVHHRIVRSTIEYPWSSFGEVVCGANADGDNAARSNDAGRLDFPNNAARSNDAGRLDNDAGRFDSLISVPEVLDLFDGIDGFKKMHLEASQGLVDELEG